MADPVSAAILVSSLAMAGATTYSALNQPELEEPETPDFEAEAAKAAKGEQRRVAASSQRLSRRQATRGPVQLQAASLGF